MTFEQFGDRLECWLAKPISFCVFIAWCIFVPLWNVDVANYGISFVTALVLFLTLGTSRKDRMAIHIKLDDLEKSIDGADSSNAGIEKRLTDR